MEVIFLLHVSLLTEIHIDYIKMTFPAVFYSFMSAPV